MKLSWVERTADSEWYWKQVDRIAVDLKSDS